MRHTATAFAVLAVLAPAPVLAQVDEIDPDLLAELARRYDDLPPSARLGPGPDDRPRTSPIGTISNYEWNNVLDYRTPPLPDRRVPVPSQPLDAGPSEETRPVPEDEAITDRTIPAPQTPSTPPPL
jgi:hypothetical protein